MPGYTRIGKKEVEPSQMSCSATGYQLVKFVMDGTLDGIDRVEMSYCDLPVFRLGEVYLNYAEALAELGTLTQSNLDASINLLRSRVGMPALDMAAANADPDVNYMGSAKYGYTSAASNWPRKVSVPATSSAGVPASASSRRSTVPTSRRSAATT